MEGIWLCIEETTQQEGQPVVPTLYAVKLKIPEFGCHSAGVETWKPIFQVEFQQHKIPGLWSAFQKALNQTRNLANIK